MAAQLNHTIVWSSDPEASATFLVGLLDLPPPRRFGQFHVVELSNGVALDFAATEAPIQSQHYAFLIGDAAFDDVIARICEQGLEHWADPFGKQPGQINREDGGRGVYFLDLDGHNLEVMTRPYGGA